MLNRDHIVPSSAETVDESIERILPGIQANPNGTIETVLKMRNTRNTREGDIRIFCEAVKKLRKIGSGMEPLIYEAFLKLTGFEESFKSVLKSTGIAERQELQMSELEADAGERPRELALDTEVAADMESVAGIDNETGDGGMDGGLIIRMARNRIKRGSWDRDREGILAYAIVGGYCREYVEYHGMEEVVYILNYIFKSREGAAVEDEVLRWADRDDCASAVGDEFLYVGTGGFFMGELRFSRDCQLLEAVIRKRRSQRLLLQKLPLLYKAESGGRDSFVRIRSLITESLNAAELESTEDILKSVDSEELSKAVIGKMENGCGLLYRVCHRINGPYIEVLLNNMDHFDMISETDLNKIMTSPFLPIICKEYTNFRILVDELLARKMAIPLDRLFPRTATGKKHAGGQSGPSAHTGLRADNSSANGIPHHQRHLAVSESADIDKIYYLLIKGVPVDRRIISPYVLRGNEETVLKIFMKVRDIRMLRKVFALTGKALVTLLRSETLYDPFYVRCLNYLVRKGVDITTFQLANDHTFWGRLLQCMVHGLRPATGAVAPVPKNTAFSASLLTSPGLFLNRGKISISNDNRKFTIHMRVAFELFDADNRIISFGNGTAVLIRRSSVYFQFADGSEVPIFECRPTTAADTNSRPRPHNWDTESISKTISTDQIDLDRISICDADFTRTSRAKPEDNRPALNKIYKLIWKGTPRPLEPSAQSPAQPAHSIFDKPITQDWPITESQAVITVKYNKKNILININGIEFQTHVHNCNEIFIELVGKISHFIYYQSGTGFNGYDPSLQTDSAFYRQNILPIQKMLKYKQKKGLVLNGPRIFRLNGKIAMKIENGIYSQGILNAK